MIKIRVVVFWGMWDRERQEGGIAKGHGKAFGVMDIFIILIVVIISEVYGIKHFKYIPFLYI